MNQTKFQRLRKRAIVGLLALVGLAGTATLGPPLYVKAQDSLNRTRIEEKLTDLEENLSAKYGIDIEAWEQDRDMFGGPPVRKGQESLRTFSPYIALRALEGLEEVLGCYPADIIEQNYSGIEIVRSFTPFYDENGREEETTPLANISFGGNMSISAGRDDITIYHKAVLGKIFEKDSLHHEIGHELTRDLPKEDWIAINPDAKYDKEAWKDLQSTPAGFFNKYATHSPGEDIASTVELLYSDRATYDKSVSRDSILKAKAESLKAWYFEISDGRFDQDYWNTVQSCKTPIFENKFGAGKRK